MLVLSRHRDESISLIMDGRVVAKVHLVDVRGNKARIGVEAGEEVAIYRSEMSDAIADAIAGRTSHRESRKETI